MHVKSKDPYNMEEIVMPLHKYIADPIAQDIVHNGATFQVTRLLLLQIWLANPMLFMLPCPVLPVNLQ